MLGVLPPPDPRLTVQLSRPCGPPLQSRHSRFTNCARRQHGLRTSPAAHGLRGLPPLRRRGSAAPPANVTPLCDLCSPFGAFAFGRAALRSGRYRQSHSAPYFSTLQRLRTITPRTDRRAVSLAAWLRPRPFISVARSTLDALYRRGRREAVPSRLSKNSLRSVSAGRTCTPSGEAGRTMLRTAEPWALPARDIPAGSHAIGGPRHRFAVKAAPPLFFA